MTVLAEILVPELRVLPRGDRGPAVRRALSTPLGAGALLALAVAVLGTTVSPAAGAFVAALVVLRHARRGVRGADA